MNTKKWVLIASLVMVLGGMYLLFLLIYPELSLRFGKSKFQPLVVSSGSPASTAVSPVSVEDSSLDEQAESRGDEELLYDTVNKLYIEKIGLVVDIIESSSQQALDQGAWHRRPQQGDPEIGGNFILTGHRFGFGFTPGAIAQNSSFYHLDKLKPGDVVTVYWNQKRYEYQVDQTKTVHPNDIWIENQTTEHILTLYTCTLKGEFDGRVVVTAKPLL